MRDKGQKRQQRDRSHPPVRLSMITGVDSVCTSVLLVMADVGVHWLLSPFTPVSTILSSPPVGSVLYCQSRPVSCRYAAREGTSEISFSSGPASSSSTDQWGTSDSLLATTAPAEPPPTTMKSYSRCSWRWLMGRDSGSKESYR